MRRIVPILALAALTAACHTYRPVTTPPEAGSDVRIRLTAPGAIELSRESDDAVRTYQGQLVGTGPDTLTLSVVQARSASQFQPTRTLRNEFPIPRSFVEGIEVRELSAWRTTLVSAAAAGVVGFLIYRAAGGGGGSDPGDGENGTIQTIRVPARLPPP